MNARSGNLSVLVRVFCNVGYFIGMCPFRISKDIKSEFQSKVTCWFAKILYVITTVLLILNLIAKARIDFTILTTKRKHPFQCFYCGFEFCNIIETLLTSRLMWYRGNLFLDLTNFLVTTNATNLPQISKKTSLKIKTILLLLIVCLIGGVFARAVLFIHEHSIKLYILKMYYVGRFTYYMEKITMNLYLTEPDPLSQVMENYIFLGSFTLIFNIFR